MNTQVLWTNFLNQIKDELSSLAYETWFSDTNLYSLEEGKAIIIVPMPIHKKHLSDNYDEQIKFILNNITGTNFELDFVLEEELKEIEEKTKKEKIEAIPDGVPHNKEQTKI